MLRRTFPPALFVLALIANVTAFASEKGAWASLKQKEMKAVEKSELKAAAADPHLKPHVLKWRGGGMISGSRYQEPGGGHMKFSGPSDFDSAEEEAADKSSSKLKAVKDDKP